MGRGYKEDKYGFILINTKRKLKTNEPYALASQAQQVYYVKDTKDPNWLVVVKTKSQDWYDMPEESINEVCQENEDIDSVSFTSKTSNNEHEFSLNINDLGQSTTSGNPMMSMEVIDDNDNNEESDGASIDVTDDEENNVIDEDNSDDN
ncbi:hypothetical protein VNO80_07077 [Phaseolus coccineus]|uniref:DUF4216 domain-containing protein n=1 Tax=Phaseolus coccineus TaxID=3886 RepID=A0AAN9NIX9_PHACN